MVTVTKVTINEILRPYFKSIFALLLEISRKERFTLIVDEFQEFYNINSAIDSEMQHLWDLNKGKSKLNLILIGSVYSLRNSARNMRPIFPFLS